MDKRQTTTLRPHLVVAGAPQAIAFYVQALGASVQSRYADPNLGGQIVHAELSVDGATFTLAEESHASHNDAPGTLGGSPVILTLEVPDADAVGARMERGGAQVVFPIADQFYGKRQGRLVDPFGHVWIISQHREDLSPDEIQRRVDGFLASASDKG